MKKLIAWLFSPRRPRCPDETIIRGVTAAEHRARMRAQFAHDDAEGSMREANKLFAEWRKQAGGDWAPHVATSATYRVAHEQAQDELMKKISP